MQFTIQYYICLKLQQLKIPWHTKVVNYKQTNSRQDLTLYIFYCYDESCVVMDDEITNTDGRQTDGRTDK